MPEVKLIGETGGDNRQFKAVCGRQEMRPWGE